jgi:putative acetyltransferase
LSIEIRPERDDDVVAIRHVVADAFGSPLEARLVERIRATPQFIPDLALVAVDGDDVVGHVMISYCDLVGPESRRQVCTLSPLAVAPARQGDGIGSALVRAAVARADERGEPLVVLEGNPRYYARFGFEHALPLGIEIHLPDWAPSEAGQVIRLRNYDASMQGRIVYSSAFDEVAQH